MLQELQCRLPPGSEAVYCRSCTSHYPPAVRQCVAGLALPGTPVRQCPTAWGAWAMGLLQYTASMPAGCGQWDSCNTQPHCLGALGSATSTTHCLTAWGQWAVQVVQPTASLCGGSAHWESCNTLPRCLGALCAAAPAMHCLAALGKWAVQLLPYSASLLGGSGQWNSCNAPPHYLGQCVTRVALPTARGK